MVSTRRKPAQRSPPSEPKPKSTARTSASTASGAARVSRRRQGLSPRSASPAKRSSSASTEKDNVVKKTKSVRSTKSVSAAASSKSGAAKRKSSPSPARSSSSSTAKKSSVASPKKSASSSPASKRKSSPSPKPAGRTMKRSPSPAPRTPVKSESRAESPKPQRLATPEPPSATSARASSRVAAAGSKSTVMSAIAPQQQAASGGMKWMCHVTILAGIFLYTREVTGKDPLAFNCYQWVDQVRTWLYAAPEPTVEGVRLYGGFMILLYILSWIAPGKTVDGVELKDGSRRRYKCNGLSTFVIVLCFGAYGVHKGWFAATVLADRYAELFVIVNVICFASSAWLYIYGRLHPDPTAVHPPSGNPVMDFVMGVTLNPKFFGLDWKFFWLRPSMMGWGLFVLSFVMKQLEETGTISTPMALYAFFSLSYIFDYFIVESAMLTTWDIVAENFGLMLVWGDLVFIQFFFALQGWYICTKMPTTTIPDWHIALCLVVFFVGYSIFRFANLQKDQFKRERASMRIGGRPVETVGGRLLVSGWWGLSRHINYLGDILIAASFCLPCGFDAIVPWSYFFYLTILLIHRERRDNAKCAAKYQDMWDAYCARVPYRIVPFVY